MKGKPTSFDRCPEGVRIHAVVIADLEFRNVERHVFGADFVERADPGFTAKLDHRRFSGH
jgi:hypothetical protein